MAIRRDQALDLLRSHDFLGLGMEADALRRRLHPEGVVTYLLEETIDLAGREADMPSLLARIGEGADAGLAGVQLRGLMAGTGMKPLEELLAAVKQSFPQIALRAFTPGEITAFAEANEVPVSSVLLKFQNAGLDSIGDDDGASADPLQVHRAAHRLGMTTTATLTFGAGESLEQRLDVLEQLRLLQQETGGFAAFEVRNAVALRGLDEATAVEYLKMIAVARLYLDNIENLQAGLSTHGLKVLQMGLRFGVNDAGSIAAASRAPGEEDLRRIIRDAGFQPRQRDPLYRSMFVN